MPKAHFKIKKKNQKIIIDERKEKMKNKIFAFLVCVALLISSVPAVFASAEEATSPEIISQNIEYDGYFGLMYAVDAATVKGGKVTVTVYDSEMTLLDSYTSTNTETITRANGEEVSVYVLTTAPVAAKDMADVYYAKATDGEGNEGALKRYSVGEYLYERLYLNGIINAEEGTKDYNKKVFYENVLAMGASAQTVLVNDKKAEGEALETLVTDYKYVNVTGGTLSDGYTSGIFENGTTVTVRHLGTAPAGQRLIGWASGSAVYSQSSFELNSHAILTPSYGTGIIDFENDKISMGYELKSTNSSLYVTTQHGRKCAYLRTYSDGADSITFTPTVMAEENYNTVVFDTMIQLGHKGPSTTYYQNYALTDANGNVAYKFTLRHGDAGMQFNDGTNNEQLLIAPKDTWFNLRIEYTYIDENTVTVNTYVDNTLKFSSTNFVGETAIKDVCVFKHTTDSGIGAAVFYDDVSFKQIYVAPAN